MSSIIQSSTATPPTDPPMIALTGSEPSSTMNTKCFLVSRVGFVFLICEGHCVIVPYSLTLSTLSITYVNWIAFKSIFLC